MKEFFENLPSTIGQILVLIAVVVLCPEVLMVIPIIFLSIVFLGFMS